MQQIDKNVFYIDMLEETLKKKDKLLDDLIYLTKKLQETLSEEKVEYEVIDDIISRKEEAIQDVLEIDDGFQALYEKVKQELDQRKGEFKENILRLQTLIKVVVEKGIRIKGLESQNKVLFDQYMKRERGKIKGFKVSNAAASTYYKNMANLQMNESYFLDKKK